MGIFSRRKREYDGEELFVIDQVQFERIVAETLRTIGFESVTITEEASDKRASIQAKYRKRDILVKCNYYDQGSLVGAGHVQDLAETLANSRADEAYLFTTSRFSQDARSEAAKDDFKDQIFLVDVKKLNRWRRKNSLAPVVKYENREHLRYNGEALPIFDPYQFERIVAETIKGLGYEKVSVTKGSGDRGADVKAELPLESGLLVSTIIQCKLYSQDNTVGHSYIRDLIGSMMIHEADEAYLVTTSDFSQGAYAEVLDGFEDRIFLVNGKMFNKWRRKAGLAPIFCLDVSRMYAEKDDAIEYDDGQTV